MKFSGVATTLLALAAVSPVAAQPVISLHGSGTTNPSKCYWTIMDQLMIQAKLPIQMTYRAVGSSTGQAEFIGDGITSDNMFGSGDIAFSQEKYDAFPADSILHLPVVLGAISFFHSVPTGSEKLNLSPCLLAKILKRDITDWGDSEIKFANPNLSVPNPSPTRRLLLLLVESKTRCVDGDQALSLSEKSEGTRSKRPRSYHVPHSTDW